MGLTCERPWRRAVYGEPCHQWTYLYEVVSILYKWIVVVFCSSECGGGGGRGRRVHDDRNDARESATVIPSSTDDHEVKKNK
jgi:hypothetical protein